MATPAKKGSAPTGWNWGAFWLTWIWGIGNRVWIALLALIPVVNIIMAVVLGVKGNELAWKARDWKNEAEFRQHQRTWSIAGFVLAGLTTLFVIACIILAVFVVGATEAPVDASRQYVAEMQANNVDQAYSDSSKLFQTVTSKEDLQSVATTQQKVSTGVFHVQIRSRDNDRASVVGTLKGKEGGDVRVRITLIKEGDRWLVQSYTIE